ncbi:MAG: hypothetical protein LBT90_02345 [Holosporaceae bacterium]|nr:hypothetical protein [Holosporaceae bacterium]
MRLNKILHKNIYFHALELYTTAALGFEDSGIVNGRCRVGAFSVNGRIRGNHGRIVGQK